MVFIRISTLITTAILVRSSIAAPLYRDGEQDLSKRLVPGGVFVNDASIDQIASNVVSQLRNAGGTVPTSTIAGPPPVGGGDQLSTALPEIPVPFQPASTLSKTSKPVKRECEIDSRDQDCEGKLEKRRGGFGGRIGGIFKGFKGFGGSGRGGGRGKRPRPVRPKPEPEPEPEPTGIPRDTDTDPTTTTDTTSPQPTGPVNLQELFNPPIQRLPSLGVLPVFNAPRNPAEKRFVYASFPDDLFKGTRIQTPAIRKPTMTKVSRPRPTNDTPRRPRPTNDTPRRPRPTNDTPHSPLPTDTNIFPSILDGVSDFSQLQETQPL